jgi:hypothetical protein
METLSAEPDDRGKTPVVRGACVGCGPCETVRDGKTWLDARRAYPELFGFAGFWRMRATGLV